MKLVTEATNVVIGVAVGEIDLQMANWDAKKGRGKPFQNALDLTRAAEVAVGYGVELFMDGKLTPAAQALRQSAIPGLYQSIRRAVTPAARVARFIGNRASADAAMVAARAGYRVQDGNQILV